MMRLKFFLILNCVRFRHREQQAAGITRDLRDSGKTLISSMFDDAFLGNRFTAAPCSTEFAEFMCQMQDSSIFRGRQFAPASRRSVD